MKRFCRLLLAIVLISPLLFSSGHAIAADAKAEKTDKPVNKAADAKSDKMTPKGPGAKAVIDKPLTRAERKKLNAEKARKVLEERRKNMPPIKMVYVEGGCFNMGDFTGEGDEDEHPVHKVCLSDYYIGEVEVTNGLWEHVMGMPFAEGLDPKMPLTGINWNWANRFIETLNDLVDGFYRMPTEAEWEYAARERGKKIRWSGTDMDEDIQDYAWFSYNSNYKVHYGRQKKPNALGIYDMTGNAWEWVEDNFDFDYYKNSEKEDPFGPEFSNWRTIRGGSVYDDPRKIRTTYRHAKEANLVSPVISFRLAE